jgi:transaldolase
MIKHPLTDKGLEAFLKDWEKVKAQTEAELIAKG